jgi:ABC-type polysaccharide/polyol phosphate export permease
MERAEQGPVDRLLDTSDIQVRSKSNFVLALEDLLGGFANARIWSMLAWQEIRQRYRRSMIGPFWLTISTGVMIGGMGPLYGKLFNQDISTYLTFLATSLVIWQLISQLAIESCQAFIGSEGFIKQLKLPLTVHVLRVVWKNLIMFFHNLIVVVIVFLFVPPIFGPQMLLSPLGIGLLAINGVWVGVVLGLICARFRDIPQIIGNLVLVAFFLTPVLWQPAMLGRHAWTVNLNPLYHFMEVVRGPLLGSAFNMMSWAAAVLITICGYAFMLAMFSRYRARVAYWV